MTSAHGKPDPDQIFYHGTTRNVDTLDPKKTLDGGLHFGDLSQATVRARGRLIMAKIDVCKVRRCRDLGGQWKERIADAKTRGFDSVVYLNRYEGIPLERIMEAQAKGINLDLITDSQFRKLIPEAQDSWIVFDKTQIRQATILPELGDNIKRRCDISCFESVNDADLLVGRGPKPIR